MTIGKTARGPNRNRPASRPIAPAAAVPTAAIDPDPSETGRNVQK